MFKERLSKSLADVLRQYQTRNMDSTHKVNKTDDHAGQVKNVGKETTVEPTKDAKHEKKKGKSTKATSILVTKVENGRRSRKSNAKMRSK